MSLDDLTQLLVKHSSPCPCCGELLVSAFLYREDLGFMIGLGCRSCVVSEVLTDCHISGQKLSLLFDELSFDHANLMNILDF